MNGYKITEKITNYEKRGSRWVVVDSKTQEITADHYKNATDQGWARITRALGGYERNERSYTIAGYLITRINSINPTRDQKTVRDILLIIDG